MSLSRTDPNLVQTIESQERHIVRTPSVRGGRPRIAGRRITVADIAFWHVDQEIPVKQLVADYGLTFAQVYAALAYYFDHKSEIDSQSEDDTRVAEVLKSRFPSKVAAKLAERG